MAVAILKGLLDGRPHKLRNLGSNLLADEMAVAREGDIPAFGIMGDRLCRLGDRQDRVLAGAVDPIRAAVYIVSLELEPVEYTQVME